jgi:uncharacterized protein YyaL (SSP411 family)
VADGADRNLTRAVLTYRALQKSYYVKSAKLYKGGGPGTYSFVWPFSQALSATISLDGVAGQSKHYARDVRDRFSGLAHYYDSRSNPPGYAGGAVAPYGHGGTKSYDDNDWLGLELVRQYRATHDTRWLRRADRVFQLIAFGWDRDPTHPCPGGVLFSQSSRNTDRNTVSNAPGAELALRLYQITHDGTYLNWARAMYEWVRGCLMTSGGTLFLDHITFNGGVERTIWTYNQGTMIGASVLLYQATGQKSFLSQAKRTARAAMARFTQSRLAREPPAFVAIMFENLSLLDAVRHDSAYRHYMQAWADRAWSKMRDSKTNLFRFEPSRSPAVLTQAAMVKLYANLARRTSSFR